MLADVVDLILSQANHYIHQADNDPVGAAEPVVRGNIAQWEHLEIGSDLENQLVLTLVKVEEEATLKNSSASTREASGAVIYRNPPLHLNLFILFSANYRNYDTALKRLSQILTFFQGKNKFTLSNSPGAIQGSSPVSELSLTMDLLSLSFEEVNYLWGSLGGKQMPFAAYRGRLVVLEDRRVLQSGGDVREIEVVGRGVQA